jgi:hypothetical protein
MYLSLCFSLIFILNTSAQSSALEAQDLVNELLTNYLEFVRPSTPINIFMDISLRQITSIDEKNQLLITNLYVTQYWKDDRLAWNLSSHNDIKWIRVQATKIWVPDTYIINAADTIAGYLASALTDHTYASVKNDGTVYLSVPVISRTRCRLNTRVFPFDKQLCSLRLTSWSYGNDIVRYPSNETILDLSDYTENNLWALKRSTLSSSVTFGRQIDGTPNDELVIRLLLARKSLYYMTNAVYPCLILNILTLLSYLLPYSVQIELSMACLLTLTVNSVRVSNDIPIQSDYVPTITIYFVISIFYPFISMFWFVARNHFEKKCYLPIPLIKLVDFLQIFKSFKIKYKYRISKKPENIDQAYVSTCNLSDQIKTFNVDKNKENDFKEDNKIQSKITILNYVTLVIFTLCVFVSQLAIWLSMIY